MALNSKSDKNLLSYTLSTAVLKTFVIPEADVKISTHIKSKLDHSTPRVTSYKKPTNKNSMSSIESMIVADENKKYSNISRDICNLSFVIPSKDLIKNGTSNNLNNASSFRLKNSEKDSSILNANVVEETQETIRKALRPKPRSYTILTNVLESYVIPQEDIIPIKKLKPSKKATFLLSDRQTANSLTVADQCRADPSEPKSKRKKNSQIINH